MDAVNVNTATIGLARRLNELIDKGEYKVFSEKLRALCDWDLAQRSDKPVPEDTLTKLGLEKNDSDIKWPLFLTMNSYANKLDQTLISCICEDNDALSALIDTSVYPLHEISVNRKSPIAHALHIAAIEDETILHALRKYPQLFEAAAPNRDYLIIWDAVQRPMVLEAILERLKSEGIQVPRSLINGDSPHTIAVDLSMLENDRAHQSLKILLAAEPKPSEQTWLSLLRGRKTHLIDLYPAGIKYPFNSTLCEMIYANWSDDAIAAMVDRGAPIRSVSNGASALHNFITAKRWPLIIRLLDKFSSEWNVGDLVNTPPLKTLMINNFEVVDNKKTISLSVPKKIIAAAIANTNFRHMDVQGTSVLYDMLNVMPVKDVFRELKGRHFHVRVNRWHESPLDLLTAVERIELWKIAVDNFIQFAKDDPPYRTSDKLCAENPTAECREDILKRCKRTGICYPTPIHWAPFIMPILDLQQTATYFIANFTLECLYNVAILSQYKDVMIPFLYPDKDILHTRDYSANLITPSHLEPTKAPYYSNFHASGTHTFDYMALLPDQNYDVKFDTAVRNALAQRRRWLFFMLAVQNGGHANLVLVDLKNFLLERFDPNRVTGEQNYEAKIERQIGGKLRRRMEFLISEFKGKTIKLDYKTTVNTMNYPFGMSSTNADVSNTELVYDPEGHCAAHCYLYLELRMLNPEILPEQIIGRLLKFQQKKSIEIATLIRAYARTINTRAAPFLRSVGLSEEELYKKYNRNNLDRMFPWLDEFFFKYLIR